MKQLVTSEEKVQMICDTLKRETLEPAQREAAQIVEEGKAAVDQMIEDAKKQIKEMEREARHRIEEQQNVFDASLTLAAKQALEALKQEIEQSLFNDQLKALIEKKSSEVDVTASIIEAIVRGIEKEGLDGDVEAFIAKSADPKKVSQLLAEDVLSRIKEVTLGDIAGGAKVRVANSNLTISLSDEVLIELLASFLRDDFRAILFRDIK